MCVCVCVCVYVCVCVRVYVCVWVRVLSCPGGKGVHNIVIHWGVQFFNGQPVIYPESKHKTQVAFLFFMHVQIPLLINTKDYVQVNFNTDCTGKFCQILEKAETKNSLRAELKINKLKIPF